MFWLAGDQLDLPKGGELTLRYRVVVHAGDSQEAGIASLFDTYKHTAKSEQNP